MATERYALKVPGAKSASPDITVVAPFDRKPIAKVATADAGAVEQALAVAHKLYRNRDAWLPLAKRIDILEKTASLMRSRAEFLAVDGARGGRKAAAGFQGGSGARHRLGAHRGGAPAHAARRGDPDER